MNGNARRPSRHLQSLLISACAVVTTWAWAAGAFAATVQLSTTDGAPGGTVQLTMSLTAETGDPPFAGAQVDLILERAQLGIDAQCAASAAQCDSGLDCADDDACVLIPCEADPRFTAQNLVANSPRFQNVPTTASKRLRLGIVIPGGLTTFGDGTLLTCELEIPSTATTGLQNLSTDRLVVSDETGEIIPAEVVVNAGRIVEPTELTPAASATPTPTATPTGGTPTPTSQATTPPATSTPTSTPNGGGGTPTSTPTAVAPTATNTSNGGGGTPTSTPTRNSGGGGGDGCDCAITPEADRSKGTALLWLSLLPVALVYWRRSRV